MTKTINPNRKGAAAENRQQLPPETETAVATPAPAARGKTGQIVEMLRRPEGASIEEMTQATGWQAHSVRGAIAGAIKKKLGLKIISGKVDDARRYRIEAIDVAG